MNPCLVTQGNKPDERVLPNIMKRFQKILVPLYFTDSDSAVVSMVSKLVKWSEPSSVTFCHFAPRPDIPESLKRIHPPLQEPYGVVAMERMKAFVAEHAALGEAEMIHFLVDEGNPVARILQLVLEQEHDLLVTGMESRKLALKLARKAPCSVFVVPADADGEIRNPAVAVDFSEFSRYAYEMGTALTEAIGVDGPRVVHVSLIDNGHRFGLLPKEEVMKANEHHALRKMRDFCQSMDPQPSAERAEIHHHESVPFGVLDYVRKNEVDCLVVGCRGRDALSGMFLGSDVEQILSHSSVPVLAVKAKGTGRGFLSAFLGIDN
jgi:nucleotide-binding universal stress UspA family protein